MVDTVRGAVWVLSNLVTALSLFGVAVELMAWRSTFFGLRNPSTISIGFAWLATLLALHKVTDLLIAVYIPPWWVVLMDVPTAILAFAMWSLCRALRDHILEVYRAIRLAIGR